MESDNADNSATDEKLEIEIAIESSGETSSEEVSQTTNSQDSVVVEEVQEAPTETTSTKEFEVGGVCVIKFHTKELHKKYFGHVKHHLEQLVRETASDFTQLFYVDTARTEAAPPHKQFYESVKNESLVDDAPLSTTSVASSGRKCFNCLGDHHITECTKPIDRRAIAENRRNLQLKQQGSNARFFEDEERNSRFTPGRWGRRLLDAMGVRRNELPAFVYRMRVLGYPPGWLKEAEVETSGLKIFDGHGNEVKKPLPLKKAKKPTPAAPEDGEVLSGGSEDLDSDSEDENAIRYQPEKLIEIPGFNMPLPPGYQDEHRRYGMPPLQPHQMKHKAILNMTVQKEPAQAERLRRKMDLPAPKNTVADNAAEAATLKRKLNIPPPKADTGGAVPNGGAEAAKAAAEMPAAKRRRLDVEEDEEPQNDAAATTDPGIDPTSDGGNYDEQLPGKDDTDAPSSGTSLKLHRSLSLGSVPGTPIPASISRVLSLPDPAKWSVGVADHIPFENLPGATGTFEKMRGLLAKIKDLRNGS
ncbi:zinc finger protein-like [Tropilaelaps mercedesae]|uniref:Zinc finger protein-like n=1 Tax=Tropilaelaps mercedesae TaxID=418985 RepID=A0A1V9X103_9ACAR|nr:zinc finger protein-like [Tropilaelaps mercedesae]